MIKSFVYKHKDVNVSTSGKIIQGGIGPEKELAAIVEASDIPILSATEELQRALLRWVDLCGIAGYYQFTGMVSDVMQSLNMLDEQAYIVGVVGRDPDDWPVIWAGDAVVMEAGQQFGSAIIRHVNDARLLQLFALEYLDAVRYRRAAARRFSRRDLNASNSIDQLIFPLRDAGAFEYVLVHGESVSGDWLYSNDHLQ